MKVLDVKSNIAVRSVMQTMNEIRELITDSEKDSLFRDAYIYLLEYLCGNRYDINDPRLEPLSWKDMQDKINRPVYIFEEKTWIIVSALNANFLGKYIKDRNGVEWDFSKYEFYEAEIYGRIRDYNQKDVSDKE